ncbi:CGNR zinc finger domain-containing protein [Jatrophihabitans sp. DSM 45814]
MAFVFVSGRASLDFVGTLKWRRHTPAEQLQSPANLADWAQEAELVQTSVEVTLSEFDAAVELREAIYRTFSRRLQGKRPMVADIATLNLAAGDQPVGLVLKASGSVIKTGTSSQLLSTLARDGLDLLGSELADQVRECDQAECTRLYVDTSRTRNRRWCGMNECGNKAKVQAFRQRQRA